MCYGGAPAGPAGTGKTETVKDLGRTLGIFVVVINCSGEQNFRDMAKILKGVCQSGLWGCFDEFNRISLGTLSVVAAQVESITQAKKFKLKQFIFPTDPDKYITLNAACGYFITMNPGYAGRQELPENLKVLFRGVTMMVPDRRSIIKVKLASVGYNDFDWLDKKFTILYRLCEEQLSKQRHYDFGLRNILSVLRFAGTVLREASVSGANKTEEYLLASTLTQMNMSKFVMQDKSLFTELIGDIFPMVADQIKRSVHAAEEKAIDDSLSQQQLVKKDEFLLKLIQLYETSTVRHGFMIVGTAGCGKTTIFNTLTEALSNVEGNNKFIITKMNPKAITGQQMFGVMNSVGEWEPGIYSEIFKRTNNKNARANNWICCDGPVDAIWIENLNTVLDDNKILTLANAERIPMLDTTKMTFEVENLRNASPATVSRNGIVFVTDTDLYWEPLFTTWIRDREERGATMQPCSPDEEKWTTQLITKYFKHKSFDNLTTTDPSQKAVFFFMKKNFLPPMDSPEVVKTSQMINLLTACLKEYTST
jgi:dynein heavy chain